MEIQANYVTKGKFQGMLEVRPMEMILNNPGRFVQFAEKNTNIFAHSYSDRVLHYRYVCFINNQKSKNWMEKIYFNDDLIAVIPIKVPIFTWSGNNRI